MINVESVADLADVGQRSPSAYASRDGPLVSGQGWMDASEIPLSKVLDFSSRQSTAGIDFLAFFRETLKQSQTLFSIRGPDPGENRSPPAPTRLMRCFNTRCPV